LQTVAHKTISIISTHHKEKDEYHLMDEKENLNIISKAQNKAED
jgi:hypothetical protein